MSVFTQRAVSNSASSWSRGSAQAFASGSLASFSTSVWSPSGGSVGRKEESYHLLLELCSQEPTVQCCFKIIESTCLARGVDLEIGGKPPTPEFRSFLNRFYLPFAENALRYFFALGFVPWRLRKLSTGDVVPEAIPLGLFTWSIESMPNRVPRSHPSSSSSHQQQQQPHNTAASAGSAAGKFSGKDGLSARAVGHGGGVDKHQVAAEQAFKKQRAYFSDPKRVPYPLQGDVMRMGNRSDEGKKAERYRLKGFGETLRKQKGDEGAEQRNVGDAPESFSGKKQGRPSENTPAYYRQKAALARVGARNPTDDDETKMLRYCIAFTENCNVLEDDVEIYEYMPPTNSITRYSVLYGTVPSPLAHMLIDYRNIRTTLIRQAYADAYNTQAKLVCSYTNPKNTYNLAEGGPILNGEGWAPQQRMGVYTDTNLPTEVEANAYARDAVAETMVGAKAAEHKPLIYSLPKNTTVEPQQKLESIIDVGKLQNKFAKDVTSLLGVPYEMVYGGYSDDTSGKSRAMHNTKIFITNMMSICRHLEMLLADVYVAAYGGSTDDVKFIIRATPRIEVNTVEEICQLLEAGVVSFDNAMHLSNMILGVELQQGIGAKANAGQFSRAFITPSNKKDLIVAEKAQQQQQKKSSAKNK